MSWSFADLTAVVPVRLRNPFLDVSYPERGVALAILDTGYDGLALVPESVFRALRLNEHRATSIIATLADGTKVPLTQVLGLLEIPDLELIEEGNIETHPRVPEILVGMLALRNLVAHVNGCHRTLSLEEC